MRKFTLLVLVVHKDYIFFSLRIFHICTCQDPRAVLVGLLLVLSAFQYLNRWTRYTQVLEYIEYEFYLCSFNGKHNNMG